MTLEIRSQGTQSQQQRFEGNIQTIINAIRTRISGRHLLRRLEVSSKRVIIYPYTQADRDSMGHNAYAQPRNQAAASRNRKGPGRGSASEVHYSPNMWRGQRVQSQPDEVLFHELCHSLRQINGLQRMSGGNFRYIASFENVEEFFAAMVTSVYSSENNRPVLGNHGYWQLRNVDVLLERPYSTWINNFKSSMPDFTHDIAAITQQQAAFNPFR